MKSLSRVRLFVKPWTVAHQAPLSLGFSRQEYWSGLPFPSPGELPDPGLKPRSPPLQADASTSEPPGKPQTKRKQEMNPVLRMEQHWMIGKLEYTNISLRLHNCKFILVWFCNRITLSIGYEILPEENLIMEVPNCKYPQVVARRTAVFV